MSKDGKHYWRKLKDELKNARYMFYLAQSYKDIGDCKTAIIWYKKRVEMIYKTN